VDRFVLVKFVSLADIGLYALANQVAGIVMLAIYAFTSAWSPYIFRLADDRPSEEALARAQALSSIVVGLALVTVMVSAFSPEIVLVGAGVKFRLAAQTVPILAFGSLLFGTIPVTQAALLIEHRSRAVALLSIASAAINFAACLVLVPLWGINGAAVSTVIGFGCQAFAYFSYSQRVRPAPYQGGRTIGVVALTAPFAALGWWHGNALWLRLPAKAAIVALFPIALFSLRLVDRSHLLNLSGAVRVQVKKSILRLQG
jgi:O-antigen/teichoic acid export membrane protein